MEYYGIPTMDFQGFFRMMRAHFAPPTARALARWIPQARALHREPLGRRHGSGSGAFAALGPGRVESTVSHGLELGRRGAGAVKLEAWCRMEGGKQASRLVPEAFGPSLMVMRCCITTLDLPVVPHKSLFICRTGQVRHQFGTGWSDLDMMYDQYGGRRNTQSAAQSVSRKRGVVETDLNRQKHTSVWCAWCLFLMFD